MCPAERSGTDMKWAVAKELIDQCLSGPVDRLQWTGNIGEPTLVPRMLLRCMKYTKQQAPGVMQGFFTSGIGLTAGLSKAIVAVGITDIAFSIDSLKPETYKKIRPGLDFEKVMGNIHRFLSLNKGKIKTRVHSVAMAENYPELPAVAKYWKERVDGYSWLPADGRGGKAPAFVDEGDDYPCWSPFTGLCIAGDGTITWCCQDLLGRHGLGVFPDMSIADAWSCLELQNARELHLLGRKRELALCKNCKAYY